MMPIKLRLRRLLTDLRQARHRRELKKVKPSITREQLFAYLRQLGIKAGDVVMVHSSLKSLGFVEGGARSVLEALYQAVSPGGSLMIPTYYMPGGTMLSACRSAETYIFDPKAYPSILGKIPDTFLKFPGAQRSLHPTHSVTAVGAQAGQITGTHHLAPSTFGLDSPWDQLVKLEGKLMGLGISMGPVTFYHMVEDFVLDEFPLPVRMKTAYQLKCRDSDGNLISVPVNPLDPEYIVRRIDQPNRGDLRDYFWKEFKRAGLLKEGKVGDSISWFIPARDFYDHLVVLMKQGITIYSTPEDLRRRPLPE